MAIRLAAQSRSASEDQSASHDGGGVAAQLQRHVLARDGVQDRVPDRAGAGERDHRQPRVGDQAGHLLVRARAAPTTSRRAARSRRAAPRAAATDSGVAGAGLTSTGAPTASAGATLWATRFSGKLNGAMASTGPRGKRRTIAARPAAAASVSRRSSSPPSRRTSSAAHRNVAAALVASDRAQRDRLAVLGRDESRDLLGPLGQPRRTRASGRRPGRRATAAAATGAAAWAAATAASTCAASGTETVATSESSYGWRTSRLRRPVSGRPAT